MPWLLTSTHQWTWSWLKHEPGPCAIWDISLKLIIISNLLCPEHLFQLSNRLAQPCSVQNFKTIWQLSNKLTVLGKQDFVRVEPNKRFRQISCIAHYPRFSYSLMVNFYNLQHSSVLEWWKLQRWYLHFFNTIQQVRGSLWLKVFAFWLVIFQWDEALMTMSTGEKCEVVIEPEWAYGRKGVEGKVPRHATLTFEIELVGINA